jgi:hypothetical protein
VAWFICPVIVSAIRDQWKIESDIKRNIAKSSALHNEKDMILARIDELPAWVFFPDVERCEWLNKVFTSIMTLNHQKMLIFSIFTNSLQRFSNNAGPTLTNSPNPF